MPKRLAAALLTAAFVSGCATRVEGPVVDGYLCCSLRTDGRTIYDYNDDAPGTSLLRPGTPARVTGYTTRWFSADIDGKPQQVRNDYSRNLDAIPFAQRYIVTQDPKPRLAAFPPAYREAILAGRVALGMTREQVLMALGYPVASETPKLEAPGWRFWRNGSLAVQVNFDEKGQVRSVSGDPAAVSRALAPSAAVASATP